MEIPHHVMNIIVSLSLLLVLIGQGYGPSLPFTTKPVSMQLTGSAVVQASADRAVVYLSTFAEGSKQNKVAEEIKSTLNEVMSLLRPLTKTDEKSKAPAAILDISVDDLQSSSWQKDTIIGQSTVYTGRATIQSEFSDMESLGVVLSKLSKTPRLKVDSVKWKLSDELKAKLSADSRTKAMLDLLAKANAYIEPLGLKRLRASSIQETSHTIRSVGDPWCNSDWSYRGSRRSLASRAARSNAEYLVLHDELDGRWTPEEIEESFELESRSLEISAHVAAGCEAY